MKPWDRAGVHPDFGEDVWVFAYGSLMWRPEIAHAEARPALLRGWHRSMCVLSLHWRGTAERPGLVLGLDRGGSCRGLALRVPAADWPAARAALDAREMVSAVYAPRFLPVRLDDGRRVAAYAYVVDRSHRQYWRGAADEAAELIRRGCGLAGPCRDYLAETLRQMTALGVGEGALHRLLRLVDGQD